MGLVGARGPNCSPPIGFNYDFTSCHLLETTIESIFLYVINRSFLGEAESWILHTVKRCGDVRLLSEETYAIAQVRSFLCGFDLQGPLFEAS